ncbi:hypothetical protein D3C71_1896130 [compost metagenome]
MIGITARPLALSAAMDCTTAAGTTPSVVRVSSISVNRPTMGPWEGFQVSRACIAEKNGAIQRCEVLF